MFLCLTMGYVRRLVTRQLVLGLLVTLQIVMFIFVIVADSDCGFNFIMVDPPWENRSAYQKSKYVLQMLFSS